jgi:hypothetical protein
MWWLKRIIIIKDEKGKESLSLFNKESLKKIEKK